MAALSEVVFLVSLLTSAVCAFSHLKAEVRLGLAGEEATFPIQPNFHLTPVSYEVYLYRQTRNGSVLLKNSFVPSQSFDAEQSERVSCFFTARDAPHAFVLRNLSLSDSGKYTVVMWANGVFRDWTQFRLTVCAGPVTAAREELVDAIQWTLSDVKTSEGHTVKLYAQNLLKTSCPSRKGRNMLILDTALSFKSLESDLNVEVRSLSNGTMIRVSNVSRLGSRVCGHILVRRGEECRLYSERKCTSLFGRTPGYVHVMKAGDGLALACHPHSSSALGPVQWSATLDSLANRVPSAPVNLSSVEAGGVSNVSVRDDSLVVAVATPAHSGRYCCTPEARPQARTPHWLLVCSQLSPLRLTLIWGDSVKLQCYDEYESKSESESLVQWYRQRGPEPEDLLVEVDYFSTGRILEDLGGRVSFSRFSLTISGLRTDDSGEYICRLWEGLNRRNISCLERRIRVVKRDFYGVYASLLGSGLLGMICAVVFVTFHSRGARLETQESREGIGKPLHSAN